MDKTLRCTVCGWRGAFYDAASKPPRPGFLPPPLAHVQLAYADRQAAAARFGIREPSCPRCGHHTIAVRQSPSFHPSM